MSTEKHVENNISKIDITEDTILGLKSLRFQTIEDTEIVEFIHYHCQRLLEIAMEKNDSKEVARAVNLDTFEVLNPVFGNERSVDIEALVDQMRGTDYAFLVMHNHIIGSHFSRRDIKTFIDADNISILIVLGNDGSIFIIEKTRQISLNEILSARKTLVDWKNQTIDFGTVIAQLKEFGIVYSEM